MGDLMKKHEMTEEDIKLQFITPAIEGAGWDKQRQIRMEYNFTDGRVIVRGNVTARGKRKRTDYLLYYKPNIPLAIVEAKDNRHSVGAGMQQAIEYAEVLDIPFVYSSNGDGFLEHDMKTGKERELPLEQFPSPQDLWQRHIGDEHFTPEQEQLITEPYYFQPGDKTPRYYQRIAINRTVDAGGSWAEPYSPRYGNRHRKDLYCFPDYPPPLEIRPKEKDPVSCRPQHSR